MYKLTKAVSLPILKKGNKDFKAGNHEIPDLDINHWYVKSLFKSKAITVISKQEAIVIVPKTPERQVERIEIRGPEVPHSMQVIETDTKGVVEIKKVNTDAFSGDGAPENKEPEKIIKDENPKPQRRRGQKTN